MKREMTAARREILMLLRKNGPQTAHALAAIIGITPVGVRKHLDALEIDGLVETKTERRPIGRPVQIYSLTESADDIFPKAYESMLASLLRQVEHIGGEELLLQVLNGRAEELEAMCRERCPHAKSLEERIATLASVRDEAGYMVEWQRDGDRFILREYNCALFRVARHHPQFCRTEMDLFRRVLGDKAIVHRTEHAAEGARQCTYIIERRPPNDIYYEEQDADSFVDADAIC